MTESILKADILIILIVSINTSHPFWGGFLYALCAFNHSLLFSIIVPRRDKNPRLTIVAVLRYLYLMCNSPAVATFYINVSDIANQTLQSAVIFTLIYIIHIKKILYPKFYVYICSAKAKYKLLNNNNYENYKLY